MRTSNSPKIYYTIFGRIKRETEKAYLFVIARTKQEFWLPKSQCHDPEAILDPDMPGEEYSVEVAEWILNDKAVPEADRFSTVAEKKARPADKPFDEMNDDIPF